LEKYLKKPGKKGVGFWGRTLKLGIYRGYSIFSIEDLSGIFSILLVGIYRGMEQVQVKKGGS